MQILNNEKKWPSRENNNIDGYVFGFDEKKTYLNRCFWFWQQKNLCYLRFYFSQ